MSGTLEHINITVPDPHAVAGVLSDLFDWHIRWEGSAINEGYSVHVGNGSSYLALYEPPRGLQAATPRYVHAGSLAHVGIVVDDLDAAEARVKAAGFKTFNHADYEPGRRFYFNGPGSVEYEVIHYD